MTLFDAMDLAATNLKQAKLRTLLTTLGVIIGIGALVSMVAFGLGMQKNVSEVFYKNDLFTSIYVSLPIPEMEDLGQMSTLKQKHVQYNAPALNDSTLRAFRALPNVALVHRQIEFPVKVVLMDRSTKTSLDAAPLEMGQYPPYKKMKAGRFFLSDSERTAIIGTDLLKKLKLKISDKKQTLSLEDSIRGFKTISLEQLVGDSITLYSSVPDVGRVMSNPFLFMQQPDKLPFHESRTVLRIIGLLENDETFKHQNKVDLAVPMRTAESIPHLGFSSIQDLMQLGSAGGSQNSGSVYVRTSHVNHVKETEEAIEAMGFRTFAILDQLEEMKTGFLIMDTALGAIGTIALVVAALGIINTLMMSILERTREIGIMKSIGGSDWEVQTIFLMEAGFIGVTGGVLGVGLGWVVTVIANAVANHYFANQGLGQVNFFFIPFWLIAAALGFSICVSIAAGLYPANHAARINPVDALRHE